MQKQAEADEHNLSGWHLTDSAQFNALMSRHV